MRVGRVYLAASIKGGFEVRLLALWTARVTSATVGGGCGSGGGGRGGLDVGVIGGGYGCNCGPEMGGDVYRSFTVGSDRGGERVFDRGMIYAD